MSNTTFEGTCYLLFLAPDLPQQVVRYTTAEMVDLFSVDECLSLVKQGICHRYDRKGNPTATFVNMIFAAQQHAHLPGQPAKPDELATATKARK